MEGDAEKLDFKEGTFDRVLATCLLHHLHDPLRAMEEARRVASKGAEICFVIPTDPGILNRAIKKFITFRKLRKISIYPPELYYALDHQNHVESLLQIFKYVFREDEIKVKYFPFRFRSWNLNLLMTLKATKNRL